MKESAEEIRRQLPFLGYAPIVFTSAVEGTGVEAAVDTALTRRQITRCAFQQESLTGSCRKRWICTRTRAKAET